jgi:hypothetical protein
VKKTRKNLKSFAGVGVTYARQEEACAKRQHDNVQHGMFLCDVNRGRTNGLALVGGEVPPGA